jgi:histidyl-tRNA synthetase
MDPIMEIARKLRKRDVSAETDLMRRDLRKQLEYASSRGIPFSLIIGQKEIDSGRLTLRNMKTGKEEALSLDQVIARMKE